MLAAALDGAGVTGTARVLHAVISGLTDRLAAHQTAAGQARPRVRAAVHAGHLMLDEDGAVGEPSTRTSRRADQEIDHPLR